VKELEKEHLCGYIFKAKSPSSGMERVKVYTENGGIAGKSSGLFAREFMRAFPLLPVEEEGRLHDVDLRENFIERIFALNRYRSGPAAERTPKSIMQFQATHKFLLMSHSAKHATDLGRIAAAAKRATITEALADYEALLLRTLKLHATPAKHTNTLQHMQGYFKKQLSHDEKEELSEVIMQYKQGLVPLIVPVTLIQHYTRKYAVEYLADQVYLAPHPFELKLRNHA
jgi:uncharacterized protein YbgA (DUF1722 family)